MWATQNALTLVSTLLRRRQDRLVILREPAEHSAYPPIFLVGCPRSGTSLVRRIVDSHSRIACPPESHFLLPILKVLEDDHSMKGLESMGFPRTQVLARLRDFTEQFFSDYAQAKNKCRWADKTPLYIDCLNAIDELFQDSPLYVMIYRHGLDVAHSMTTAVPVMVAELSHHSPATDPRDPIRVAAAYWREQVKKMQSFQAAHPQRTFELRYEDLTKDPEPLLRQMFGFFDEAFEAQVLHFNNQPHDAGLEDGKIANTRTFEPRIGTYSTWNAKQLQAAIAEAEPALRSLGYASSGS